MTIGKGSTTAILAVDDIRQLIARAIDPLPLDGRRVLIIIPDGTRTAPIPLFFRLLNEQLGRRVAQLDYLIALGTHPHMSPAAIDRLVGTTADERAQRYPSVRIFNHDWDKPAMLQTIGVVSRAEADELSGGLLADDVPVTLNRLVCEYDVVLICGPVF